MSARLISLLRFSIPVLLFSNVRAANSPLSYRLSFFDVISSSLLTCDAPASCYQKCSDDQPNDIVFCLERPHGWSSEKVSDAVGIMKELWEFQRQEEARCQSGHPTRFAAVEYSKKSVRTLCSWTSFGSVVFPCEMDFQNGPNMEKRKDTRFRNILSTFLFLEKLIALLSEPASEQESFLDNLPLSPSHDLHIVIITDDALYEFASSHGKRTSIPDHIQQSLSRILNTFKQEWNITFHYLIGNESAQRDAFGDPYYKAAYKDGSHFNKALTLQNLIREKKGDSLQAHLLSKGIQMEVSHLKSARKGNFAGLSSQLSGVSRIHERFVNKCIEDVPQDKLSKDHFCSAIHGYMDLRKQRTVNLVNLNSNISTNKANKISLSDFTGSHADQQKMHLQKDGHSANEIHSLSINIPAEECGHLTLNTVVMETVSIWEWSPSKPFMKELMQHQKPVILKNSVVKTWSALAKWSWKYLKSKLPRKLEDVKCTNSFLTFDPDDRVPLKLGISLPYVVRNMSSDDFFTCITQPGECSDGYFGHYYFGPLGDSLQKDTLPNQDLFHTKEDLAKGNQFLWISSPQMITHGHFDQDFNVYVQLKGRKRFTLWSPEQYELLYPYPRIHPMWHKSRINFQQPDFNKFPLFRKSHASQVTLDPGDILFIPPYTWHYVETLAEPSVSMSTWSHDYELYGHMNAIYRHDHKFDMIGTREGQMYALRLYLDMLIHEMYGFNMTSEFFARLLKLHFDGLEDLFLPHPNDHFICSRREDGKIPTAIHVHGYVKLDVEIVGYHFRSLKHVVRDILFLDYVEEIASQVIGVEQMLSFFRYCFSGQEYYVTEADSREHSLWDHEEIIEEE